MAQFRLKTKSVQYVPSVRGHLPILNNLMGSSALECNKGTVPERYHFGTKIYPFLTITTPRGKLDLTPGEIASLVEFIERFNDGQVPYESPRAFAASAKLTEQESEG